MSTTFVISPGYAYAPSVAPESSEQLVKIACSISLERLHEKCRDLGLCAETMPVDEQADLQRTLDEYKDLLGRESLPLHTALSMSRDALCAAPNQCAIACRASGSGSQRWIDERVRRAFMLLVLEECFRIGLSVSLTIE